MDSSLAQACTQGPVVIDGGLATRLEQRGHDLSDTLWSARLLVESPHEVTAAHRDYVRAGARVLITASYQVSVDGFVRAGLSADAAHRALARSVECARAALDDVPTGGERCWVAASVGPYAAWLGDGSEYRADHGLSVEQLREWHRPRLHTLIQSAPDLLAVETIAGAAEAEAVLAEIAGTGMPAWLSMTCADGRLRSGEDPGVVWRMAADVPEVVAVGVNCTAPRDVLEIVAPAREQSGRAVVVYPNSGEEWDGEARRWTGRPAFGPQLVRSWVQAGADLVGGCCRVGPDEIREVAHTLGRPAPRP